MSGKEQMPQGDDTPNQNEGHAGQDHPAGCPGHKAISESDQGESTPPPSPDSADSAGQPKDDDKPAQSGESGVGSVGSMQ